MKDLLNRSIASLWETLPAGSIALLLDSDQIVTLSRLLEFYNSYHRNASSKRWTPEYSILLANYYIHEEENCIVASNLVFNANFLWYVNTWPTTVGCAIDHFKERATSWGSLEGSNNSNLTEDELYKLTTSMEFPRMYESYNVASYVSRSLDKLKAYTTNTVNRDYRHRALTPTNKVVDSLLCSDEYKSQGKKSRNSRSGKGMNKGDIKGEVDNEEIDIVFVDEQSKEKRNMKIGKSTKLKSLFDNYAEERSASLRSLRFSCEGSTLFLSSVGKKTPSDLDLSDGATITVTNLISQTNEADKATTATKPSKSMSKGTKKSSSNKKRTKGKQKKKAQPSNKSHVVAEETEESLKIKHSKRLSKIHEEAQPRFQHIRQRLNNLVLERSKPKVKSKKNKVSPLQPIEQHINNPPSDGLGGKAGKTHYTIQVGEVSNLYKTSKRLRRSSSSANQSQKVLKLDLHGLTKYEALKTLDESLPTWHNMAMAGSYPFVTPVDIVCGGGSQILSEVVETWIKSNDHVANAPKSKSTTWC